MRWKRVFNEIHQSFFVVGVMIGLILGAICGIVFRVNYFASPLWLVFTIGILTITYFKPKMVFIVMAVISGVIMMFFRISGELVGENFIRELYGKTMEVSGTISGDAKQDEVETKIKLTNLSFGKEGIKISGSIYVILNKNEELSRGDNIRLSGTILEGFGIYTGYMYHPGLIEWRRSDPGNLIVRVRNWFAERIKKEIPEDEAGLGLAYLLGMKIGLRDSLDENLRMVGLVHIVVASGAHLSILVGIVRKIFGKISRFAGLVLSILFIILFMEMVGWTPSIMRAGIMAIITLMAWYVGRKIASWRIILIVAGITLLINPMNLIDLGWLLSFASYIGIMIIGPALTRFFYGNKKPKMIASLVLTTISATLMTLPISLYYYGTFSLVSVIVNLLILPTLPYAMGLVFLTGLVAELPLIEIIVSWLTVKILDFHINTVEFFGALKQFVVGISVYQNWVYLIYVGFLGIVLIRLVWKKVVKLREVE